MMTEAEIATRSPFRQRLDRILGGWAAPGLGGFWTWWGRALASWLPLRLRSLLELDGRRLLVRHATGELRLELERSGQPRELARLPWKAGDHAVGDEAIQALLPAQLASVPRWVVLPASTALRRPMVLPAAAVDRLREVLGFEIDRQTPFTAADVCFDARPLGRRGDGQVEVELVVVPRAAFNAAIAPLGALGTGLAGVDLEDAGGEPLGVNLLPEAGRQHRADPWRHWNLGLAAIAVVALAGAMWLTLENRREAADGFEQASAQRIAQAREVSDQRRQVVDQVEGMRYLALQRAGRPTMVEILDELSQRLPEGTYLEKLAVENDRLLLIGQSTEASALVQLLEGSALWRSPALAGALQPDPRSRRDRFTLTAELALSTDAAGGGNGAGGADAQRRP